MANLSLCGATSHAIEYTTIEAHNQNKYAKGKHDTAEGVKRATNSVIPAGQTLRLALTLTKNYSRINPLFSTKRLQTAVLNRFN